MSELTLKEANEAERAAKGERSGVSQAGCRGPRRFKRSAPCPPSAFAPGATADKPLLRLRRATGVSLSGTYAEGGANGAERAAKGERSEVRQAGCRGPRRFKRSAPCKTRTCDLLVRSQTLYPTELRARKPRLYHPPFANRYNRQVSVEAHRQHAPASVRCFVLTISDTRTAETDSSGDAIASELTAAGHEVIGRRIVRDDPGAVSEIVKSESLNADLIVTTGGTGITARDSTYEAIAALLDKRLDGFGELFRMLSYEQIGAAAMLSRACAGSIGTTAVFALPGSTHAVKLAMDKLILPEIGHVVRELHR